MTIAAIVHEVDRAGWPPGPWDEEPDRVEWRHRDVPCLIVRNYSGALCGYAAVTPEHPDHGKDYSDIDEHIDVHGGLTYSGACRGAICHVPQLGEPDLVWWFGFDCAHVWDIRPACGFDGAVVRDASYRGVEYVRVQVERLAEQLIARAVTS